jgi:hypothetical protein
MTSHGLNLRVPIPASVVTVPKSAQSTRVNACPSELVPRSMALSVNPVTLVGRFWMVSSRLAPSFLLNLRRPGWRFFFNPGTHQMPSFSSFSINVMLSTSLTVAFTCARAERSASGATRGWAATGVHCARSDIFRSTLSFYWPCLGPCSHHVPADCIAYVEQFAPTRSDFGPFCCNPFARRKVKHWGPNLTR